MTSSRRATARVALALVACVPACGADKPAPTPPLASAPPIAPLPTRSAPPSPPSNAVDPIDAAAPEPMVEAPPLPKPTGSLAASPLPRPPPATLEPEFMRTAIYETTMPARKGADAWCPKTTKAICMGYTPGVDATGCPLKGKVDCRYHLGRPGMQPPPGGCYGDHVIDVTRRERKSGHPDVCCYDAMEYCGMP